MLAITQESIRHVVQRDLVEAPDVTHQREAQRARLTSVIALGVREQQGEDEPEPITIWDTTLTAKQEPVPILYAHVAAPPSAELMAHGKGARLASM